MSAGLVLGLNQYTHSAAACLLAEDGSILGALAKERVTRRKHDGGDTAAVVEALLEQTGVALQDIGLVVANNHLFRIRPFEQSLPFAVALHQQPPSALRDSNLLPAVAKHELSHHLAHAWSVLPLAPFDEGLIVVADGIGSARADVERASLDSAMGPYTSDADLPRDADFRAIPEDVPPHWTMREAETVYRFEGLQLARVQKRWIRERTPVFLYNYGFENMESLGAVYSRVSSHLFGDWNACGKVMGLAPWRERWAAEAPHREQALMRGPLEELAIDWPALRDAPRPAQWEAVREGDETLRRDYTDLAARVQHDLEEVLLEWLTRLREQTGARNLCLVGGVALNSTANGRLAREAGFEQVFIPPWPGDEGVAIGCALFGHHQQQPTAAPRTRTRSRTPWRATARGWRLSRRMPPATARRPRIKTRASSRRRRGAATLRSTRSWRARRWLGSRGAASSARARWAIAPSWPTRDAARWSSASTPRSRSASPSGPSPPACWPNTRRIGSPA